MKELLETIVYGLVEDKDNVKITCDDNVDAGTLVFHLNVAEQDMGRVIGKQGRIAKAIRVVMRAAAVKDNKKVMVEID
ncbi:MAG: KH domain-containing protein [Oscillospiraceae bacterium]